MFVFFICVETFIHVRESFFTLNFTTFSENFQKMSVALLETCFLYMCISFISYLLFCVCVCFQAEVDRNIELLKKKDEELTEALEKMENQSENNDIDDVIVPTAPLYKQILNLYAEENAIEDTIFYLGEALRRGVIDLEVFLKVGSCFSFLLIYLLLFVLFFSLLFN